MAFQMYLKCKEVKYCEHKMYFPFKKIYSTIKMYQYNEFKMFPIIFKASYCEP